VYGTSEAAKKDLIMDDREYAYLKAIIKDLSGIDLSSYGERQMQRRLTAFVSRTPTSNIVSYCRMLQRDEAMLRELLVFLTIKVTEFFRDPSAFRQLETLILPRLLTHGRRLNIWCAGCSSGCEPYSLAIILNRICPGHHHRIMATDVDEVALSRARDGGPCRSAEVRNLSEGVLQEYFRVSGRSYWISDKIRQAVQFERHDLLSDPFDCGFDLIMCRNVTIYLTEEAKNRLNRRFYESLKSGGVIFIGGTESIFDATEIGFTRLDHCFYTKSSNDALRSMKANRSFTPTEESRGRRNAADICTVF
jgi:chemotaxis protein methyltransferase CheR